MFDKDTAIDPIPTDRALRRTAESPPRRHGVRRLVRVLVAIVALDLFLGLAGLAVGTVALLQVRAQVASVDSGKLISVAQSAHDRLWVAQLAFGLVRLCSWPWRPLVQLADAAGGIGHLANQVPLLVDLAADGTSAGTRALDGALPVLTALKDGSPSSGDAGQRLLSGLSRGQPALRAALSALQSAQADWKAVDVAALPGAWGARLQPLGRDFNTADEALRAALAAPDLLGATRPHHYLLVPQNQWDLRATGGYVGTAAILEARQGRLKLTAYQSSDKVDDHRMGYAQPPLPLIVYAHFSNWFYRDANWSPDFPTSAELLRYFYQRGRGLRPDGVIAFDSSILPPLIRLTGPVSVPGTNVTLTAQTAVQVLDEHVNAEGTLNKGFAGKAYGAVFSRLRSLTSSRLTTAARVLEQALRERHLLLWLSDPALAQTLARHGWDGGIDQTKSDYLYVVDTNVHFNKINFLVDESIAYSTSIGADRSLRSTVRITYVNHATLAKLRRPQNNTLYEDYVRVLVPLGSRLLATSGLAQPWPTIMAYNKSIFAGYVRVPSLSRVTISFTYLVPPNAVMNDSAYRLTIQKQPGTADLPLSVDVAAGSNQIRIGGGERWGWRGRRSSDIALTAALSGGQAHPLPLVYAAAMRPTIAEGVEIEPGLTLDISLPRREGQLASGGR
jgi:hypothetical protein